MDRLRLVLRLNAASCILFGLLFVVAPGSVATFLADRTIAPAAVVLVLGVALLANGGALLATARAQSPRRAMVRFFSVGDALWVVGTVILIACGVWIDRSAGIVAALAVAAFVGSAGWLQWAAVNEPGAGARAG